VRKAANQVTKSEYQYCIRLLNKHVARQSNPKWQDTLWQAFMYPVLDCTILCRRFQKSASSKRFYITQW